MVEGTQQTQENERTVHSDSAETATQLGEKINRLRNALGNLEGKSAAELKQLRDDAKDIENYLNSPANTAAMEMRPEVFDAVRAAELAKAEVEKLKAIKDEEDRAAAKKAEEEYYRSLANAVALAEAAAFAGSSLVFTAAMLEKLGAAKESINSAVNEYQSAEKADEQAQAAGKAPRDDQLKTEAGEKPAEVTKEKAEAAAVELKKFEEKIERVQQEKEQGEIKTEIKGAEVDDAIKHSETLQKRAAWKERHAELHNDHEGKERWKGARCKCDEMHEKLHEVRDEGIRELRKKQERETGKDKEHTHEAGEQEHKQARGRDSERDEHPMAKLIRGEKNPGVTWDGRKDYIKGVAPSEQGAPPPTQGKAPPSPVIDSPIR